MRRTTPLVATAQSSDPPLPTHIEGLPSQLTQANPADPSAPRHFDFVDSLRGLAIVGVMMVHVIFWIPHFHGRMRAVVFQGDYGVQLFFVVSAFTLFWSLRSRKTQERRPLLAFYARRFFRIAPLFWFAIVFYLIWPLPSRLHWAPAGIHWPEVLATVFFVHGWWPTSFDGVVPGGWSIGAEVMFYLCIPFLFARIRTLNAALWITVVSTWVVGLCAMPFARVFAHHFPASWTVIVTNFVIMSFPVQIPIFCMGIVLYFLLAAPDVMPGSKKPRVGGLVLVVAAIPFLFGVFVPNALPGVAFVLLAAGLARRPVRLIVNPMTRFVGQISFSGYIWHFWVLHIIAGPVLRLLESHRLHLKPDLVYWGLLAATIVATLPIATISYYVIELPGQELGRKVIKYMQWGKIPNRTPSGAAHEAPGEPMQPSPVIEQSA